MKSCDTILSLTSSLSCESLYFTITYGSAGTFIAWLAKGLGMLLGFVQLVLFKFQQKVIVVTQAKANLVISTKSHLSRQSVILMFSIKNHFNSIFQFLRVCCCSLSYTKLFQNHILVFGKLYRAFSHIFKRQIEDIDMIKYQKDKK